MRMKIKEIYRWNNKNDSFIFGWILYFGSWFYVHYYNLLQIIFSIQSSAFEAYQLNYERNIQKTTIARVKLLIPAISFFVLIELNKYV